MSMLRKVFNVWSQPATISTQGIVTTGEDEDLDDETGKELIILMISIFQYFWGRYLLVNIIWLCVLFYWLFRAHTSFHDY